MNENQGPSMIPSDGGLSGQPQATPAGGQAFGQAQSSGQVPPPPPSVDQQVGVRSMASDLESIAQSGGGAPQSQVVEAPELTMAQSETAPVQPVVSPTDFSAPSPVESAPVAEATSETAPAAKSFSFKTIGLIVGIVVVAAALGYAAYYLVTSLKSEPLIDAPQTGGEFPIAGLITPTPSVNQTPAVTPTPFTHVSVIPSPTDTVTATVAELTAAGFKASLAVATPSALVVGSVRDVAFLDSASNPIKTQQIVQAFFPSSAAALSSLFAEDFSSWLYGDKAGGNKFGLLLKLNPPTDLEQAKTAARNAFEGSVAETANMFLVSAIPPLAVEFKEGAVGSTMVRYLVFDLKKSMAFEYGWVTVAGSNYLMVGTSYPQMLDMVGKLSKIQTPVPTPVPASVSPSLVPAPTSNL